MEKIKSFEEACQKLGMAPTLPEVSGVPAKHQKAIKAHYQLMVIAEALNDGWKPNWEDWNQWKYYPWFRMGESDTSPGAGFSFYACAYGYSRSFVGSRLCYANEELANYAGKQFEQLYKDYFLIE